MANPDSASVGKWCTIDVNVTANDTDPGGNYPLTLTAVSGGSGKGTPTVLNASTVEFTALGTAGTATVTYTIQNSIGLSSTGTLTVNVTTTGACQ